jgi:hypothetical protein
MAGNGCDIARLEFYFITTSIALDKLCPCS